MGVGTDGVPQVRTGIEFVSGREFLNWMQHYLIDYYRTNSADDWSLQDSSSGKVAAAKSQQSLNVEFLDTTTGEITAHTDIEYEE